MAGNACRGGRVNALGFDPAAVRDAARGALDAQRLLFDLRHGLAPEGALGDRLRVVFVAAAEQPAYVAAFARVIEKACSVGGVVL